MYLQGKYAIESDDPDDRRIGHVEEAFRFRSEAVQEVIEKWYASSQ